MHPRISLHQVAFAGEPTALFLDHCRAIGVGSVTLATPLLDRPGELEAALEARDLQVACLNHPFAARAGLEGDGGEAAAGLLRAIDLAATLRARSIYMLTGARGSLDWETAADRFAALVEPCKAAAEAKGIALLVENANAFNADRHIAHTLHDAIALAEIAGIGLCLELHACWGEAGLGRLIRHAAPFTGLVQVSDYVLGDRSSPARAVPGDGVIPLERLIGQVLEAGYRGLFDLELVGPRIEAEGPRAATTRAATYLSDLLTRLGA